MYTTATSARPMAVAFVVASLTLCLAVPAAARQADDKAKKRAQKEEQAAAKKERKYVEFREKSKALYGKDPNFKAEVDTEMREVLRAHSEYAFSVNLSDSMAEYVTRQGDRLKRDDALYDNPLVQDYVNRLGQSLVPQSSPRKYAFKVMLNPVPEARSLATGTVYVTTGILAAADNESQFAYVLAHEIAHIERDHWRDDVLVGKAVERENQNVGRKSNLFGGIARIAGSAVGGAYWGWTAGMLAEIAVPTIYKLVSPDRAVEWDKIQEDEADKLALQYMLDRKYDPRQVKYFYENLAALGGGDPRVETGFMARTERIAERVETYNQLVPALSLASVTFLPAVYDRRVLDNLVPAPASAPEAKSGAPAGAQPLNPQASLGARQAATSRALAALTPEIEQAIESGTLIATPADGRTILAEVNRDNGIRALYYDLFQMAIKNLEWSVKTRSDDPYAQYYYGKALRLVARSATDRARAANAFRKAISEDPRGVVPEARFYLALTLMGDTGTTYDTEVSRNLKEYVSSFQKTHGGELPPNMEVVYAYLKEMGDRTWTAVPVVNVSTRVDAAVAPTQAAPPAPPIEAPAKPPATDKKRTRRQ